MAPIRNNTSGMDRDDDCAGIKSDRKVGKGSARVIDETLVSSFHEVECIVLLVSVDQETAGGEEKKGSHQ